MCSGLILVGGCTSRSSTPYLAHREKLIAPEVDVMPSTSRFVSRREDEANAIRTKFNGEASQPIALAKVE